MPHAEERLGATWPGDGEAIGMGIHRRTIGRPPSGESSRSYAFLGAPTTANRAQTGIPSVRMSRRRAAAEGGGAAAAASEPPEPQEGIIDAAWDASVGYAHVVEVVGWGEKDGNKFSVAVPNPSIFRMADRVVKSLCVCLYAVHTS